MKIVNIYLFYEFVGGCSSDDNDPKLENTQFGAVKWTRNTDWIWQKMKFFISGWGIWSKCNNFRSNVSSSTKIDNGKNDILILGKCHTQGLEHTLSAEKMYSINFNGWHTKFCLSLHYNESNSYSFVNGKEIHKFKAKDSDIVATPLCLVNISKDWSVDNMKKTGLNGLLLIMILLQLMIF